MNLIKDIQNLQDLSVGEHSLEEVIGLALDDHCEECGGSLVKEYVSDSVDYHCTWTCKLCGNTYSE